ncbi:MULTISPECIES: ABC transporter ATP-binding protein [Dehalobacter]|jgi:NitT/TauT family transport system ATP-binding protein/sulfonate transport system ATP-binding protein|uniref:ABC transporter ATP-binding protein n=1 Tax=Dehalobacter restrictus (strain DSM 9455 / PER-K23) TaxID=871738 RepID=A0ABN4BRT9_DEHRP|nr:MULTISPECIES: ABC transporter ATP-binding protein [Dehalobacter]AHF10168.1 ABC transporter ATP-binding protein [Dehalobacter restrictus DSM 9455]MCG1025056.1 ABC transporter ATP-binding protein [Dehalobacter sp.]MDJ0305751.1 ABC transporter ATP-binding protein [Dehalobacter sp.]OCZ52621.1 ABC transporter ATP-binding protein [Dehalobacter sp. TeCB1]
MNKVLVEVRDVGKVFHSDWGSIEALKEVNFRCNQSEFVSIVGASGCGKTTLLRIIAGLEPPSSGEVLIDGENIDGPGYGRAVVFQEPRLFPWLTVEKNTALGIQGVEKQDEVEKIVASSLQLVGLTQFSKAYPYELSGGMAQRVSLARALTFKPKVFLMDEPFSALDAQTRARMQEEIIDLWQKTGKTVILVTHDIEEALTVSQKIMIMSPSPGTIKEVLEVPFAYPRNPDRLEFINMRKTILEAIR